MYILEYGENTDQQEKSETYMVGHVIWRKTLKNVKNKNYTLQDLEYGKITLKCGK